MNPGEIDPAVAREFPQLRLWTEPVTVPAGRRSHEGIRERLRVMSGRYNGAVAVALRAQPIAQAHRIFFRHIGLDPDTHRIPIEHHVVERLKSGAFKSQGPLADALTIACVETSIGVWALDAAELDGPLRIRPALEGERLGRRHEFAPHLPAGRLVVADAEGPVAVLFGDVALGHAAGEPGAPALLFAVQVSGVPAIHVEEAFWTVREILDEEG